MTIIDHLKWRYATKKFNPSEELSSEKIQTLKEAFNLTALSYGLQTLKMVIIKDKTKRQSLLEHAYGQRQVVDASHLIVICIQNKINEDDVNAHYTTIKTIRQTPDYILAPYKAELETTISKMSASKKTEWSKRQAYIALGNLMTVCAIEGIDSCPMEGFISEKFDNILNLNHLGLNSVLLLPVGYRAEDDMFATLKKVRKSLNETIIEL